MPLTRAQAAAFILIPFFFLLQGFFGLLFPALTKTPLLLLIGVVFYGLSEGPVFGFSIGGFAGVFLEIFGSQRFGVEIMAMGLAGFFAGLFARKLFRESFWTQVSLVLAAAFLFHLVNFLFFKSVLAESGAGNVIPLGGAADFFSHLVLAAVLSPLFFGVCRRFS